MDGSLELTYSNTTTDADNTIIIKDVNVTGIGGAFDGSHPDIRTVCLVFAELPYRSERLPAVVDEHLIFRRFRMTIHQKAGKLTTAVNPHGIAMEIALVNLEPN